jgi:tetratricopeptide (TPR) repeat protein
MALIFDEDRKGAGTHALIIASGDVPRHPGGSSAAPLGTAQAIADWLIGRFRHPGAELATIELLAAAPGHDPAVFDPPGESRSVAVEPPSFVTLSAALEGWRERLDRDPDNIAFFYYAGFVFRTGSETLLALQDFAEELEPGLSTSISFPSLVAAVAGCRAIRHLYLVDGIPLHAGTSAGTMRPRLFSEISPRKMTLSAQIEGDTPATELGAQTGFSQALLHILQPEHREKAIAVGDIGTRLPSMLKRFGGTMLINRVLGNFDLHYPELPPPQRGPAPVPGPPAASHNGTPGEAGPGSAGDIPASMNDDIDTPALHEQIAFYRASLLTFTRDRQPTRWATIQSDLGNVLGALGERLDERAALQEAVLAYRAALEIYTREAYPLEWATIQSNLGTALRALGECFDDPDALVEAIAVTRAALEVNTRERQPYEWATVQNNLGTTLRALGERQGDRGALEEAVSNYRAALEVCTRDRHPVEWARFQTNLGTALQALGEQLGESMLLEDAVSAHRSALEVNTRELRPLAWARAQRRLGNALRILGERQGDSARLEEAALAYRASLEVYARDRHPFEWAAADDGLGRVLEALGRPQPETGEPDRPAAPPPQLPAPDEPVAEPAPEEANTEFILDDAEAERDALGRSALAIGLARRLHKIWRQTNDPAAAPAAADERAAFVVHLDAPWGGGKTSFANFLARVLNPCPPGRRAAAFLGEHFPDADLGGIFLDDPPADAAAAEALAKLPADARRPWITVTFNAWQAEHCAPPWWVFYQAIRKDCFKAIWTEGDAAWTPHAPGAAPRRWTAAARRWRALRAAAQGKARWLFLATREYLWRVGNPKVLSVILLGAIGSVALVVLRQMNVLDGGQLKTWLPILSGALAGLWGLAAFFTESVAPGTASVAERLSLGAGDPFARFRTHFARMMERVRRPVMVVVDDLDRCRPDFVVDLIRGIQTLLRSPRVVFVILGDRDWIERAFESHHDKMKEVDVGPEQSFGARFVEKAIQLSFILPALGEDGQRDYVRRVLFGERAAAARARPPAAPGQADAGAIRAAAALPVTDAQAEAQIAASIRKIVNREAAAPGADPFDAAPIADKVREEFFRLPPDEGRPTTTQLLRDYFDIDEEREIERMVGEALAIRATTDEAVEREVTHELQRLAAHFPANPRQIKRIVNAITIYHAVALQQPGVTPDAAFRAQLALWVIIMTEWPKTWRLLASFPELVDLVCAAEPGEAVHEPGRALPGSPAATLAAIEPILADRTLMSLITGRGAAGKAPQEPLQAGYARILAELTPLHSRRHRLSEAAAPGREPAALRPGSAPRPASKRRAAAPRKPRTKKP